MRIFQNKYGTVLIEYDWGENTLVGSTEFTTTNCTYKGEYFVENYPREDWREVELPVRRHKPVVGDEK